MLAVWNFQSSLLAPYSGISLSLTITFIISNKKLQYQTGLQNFTSHPPKLNCKLPPTLNKVFIDLTIIIIINIINYIYCLWSCGVNYSLMIFTAFCQWNRLFSSESEKFMLRICSHPEKQIWTFHVEIISIKLIRKPLIWNSH